MRALAELGLAGAVLAISVGVLAGLSAFTAHSAKATSYLSNDPASCVNCHVMNEQYDGWLHAAHGRNATCNDCHVPQDFLGKYLTKLEHGYRHSKGFTLNDFHEPIQITAGSRAVVQANCVRCHTEMTDAIRVGGVSHAGSGPTEVLDCIRCHTRVAHGPRR